MGRAVRDLTADDETRRLIEQANMHLPRRQIDPAALGYALAAYIRVRPTSGQVGTVAKLLAELPEIVECDRITGDDCFIAKAQVPTVADLKARRVRFIGDAGQRIAEDYLRILRFFRIHAAFGAGDPDREGYLACIRARAGLASLSLERVRMEMMKLMVASQATSPSTDATARPSAARRSCSSFLRASCSLRASSFWRRSASRFCRSSSLRACSSAFLCSSLRCFSLSSISARAGCVSTTGLGSGAGFPGLPLAVLRPEAWLMIGHCGGLRLSQTIGDYVLAHAYLRDDHLLDDVLPPEVPLPAIAASSS